MDYTLGYATAQWCSSKYFSIDSQSLYPVNPFSFHWVILAVMPRSGLCSIFCSVGSHQRPLASLHTLSLLHDSDHILSEYCENISGSSWELDVASKPVLGIDVFGFPYCDYAFKNLAYDGSQTNAQVITGPNNFSIVCISTQWVKEFSSGKARSNFS